MDLGNLQQKQTDSQAEAEKVRKGSLELGRYLLATVNDYIVAHGDIQGDVVMGAVEYIRQLYQERMVAYMKSHSKMWKHLNDKIEADGLKIHEPFENDGLETNAFQRGQNPQGRV